MLDAEVHNDACLCAVVDTLPLCTARPTTLSIQWNRGHVMEWPSATAAVMNRLADYIEHPDCRLCELDVNMQRNDIIHRQDRLVTACINLASLRHVCLTWDIDQSRSNSWLQKLMQFAWWGGRWHHLVLRLNEKCPSRVPTAKMLHIAEMHLGMYRALHPDANSILHHLTLDLCGVSVHLSLVLSLLLGLSNLRTLELALCHCDLHRENFVAIPSSEASRMRCITLCCDTACLYPSTLTMMLDGFRQMGAHLSVQELTLALRNNELDRTVWKRLAVALGHWTALRRCSVDVTGNTCGPPTTACGLPDFVEVQWSASANTMFGPAQTGHVIPDDDDDSIVWNS